MFFFFLLYKWSFTSQDGKPTGEAIFQTVARHRAGWQLTAKGMRACCGWFAMQSYSTQHAVQEVQSVLFYYMVCSVLVSRIIRTNGEQLLFLGPGMRRHGGKRKGCVWAKWRRQPFNIGKECGWNQWEENMPKATLETKKKHDLFSAAELTKCKTQGLTDVVRNTISDFIFRDSSVWVGWRDNRLWQQRGHRVSSRESPFVSQSTLDILG